MIGVTYHCSSVCLEHVLAVIVPPLHLLIHSVPDLNSVVVNGAET